MPKTELFYFKLACGLFLLNACAQPPENIPNASERPQNSIPTIEILEPGGSLGLADEEFVVRWVARDGDDEATITLFYDSDAEGADGTLIVENLIEQDGPGAFSWDTALMPEGEYFIYASIDDGKAQSISYGLSPVRISHTPDNHPPKVSLIEPVQDVRIGYPGATFEVQWFDEDPDDNAVVTIGYDNNKTGFDGVQIASVGEDADAEDYCAGRRPDYYTWHPPSPGTYYLYITISDGVNDPVSVYSQSAILVDASFPTFNFANEPDVQVTSDALQPIDLRWRDTNRGALDASLTFEATTGRCRWSSSLGMMDIVSVDEEGSSGEDALGWIPQLAVDTFYVRATLLWGTCCGQTSSATSKTTYTNNWGVSYESVASLDVDGPAAVGIDANGQAAFAWTEGNKVLYAKRSESAWVPEHIGSGYFFDLAFDSEHLPHIVYQKDTELVVASRTSSGWAEEAFADGSGENVSLAFDTSDQPFLSYTVGSVADGHQLHWATKGSSNWVSGTLVSGVHSPSSIAIDPITDEPAIAYVDADLGELRLAERQGGVWEANNIEGQFSAGAFFSLAFSPAGDPCISYRYDDGLDLRFTCRVDDMWEVAVVDGVANNAGYQDIGRWNKLRFDDTGAPVIVYMRVNHILGTRQIKIARRDGEHWSAGVIAFGQYLDTNWSSASLAFNLSGDAVVLGVQRPHDTLKVILPFSSAGQ